jgi:hypothetical protein
VARKRILQNNPRDVAEDGSNVVHRTGQTDYSHVSQDYSQVEFLNQHDIVLAGDSRGAIDIVRLPRYCSPDDEDDDSDQHRPLGTLLAGKIETSDTAGELLSGSYRLKTLNEGHAFVAGFPSGIFVLYATEHASAYIRKSATRDVVQQRGLDDTLALRSNSFGLIAGRNYVQNESYITHRRHMFQTFGAADDGNRERIPFKVFESNWDFRETPSGLLAAFVDCETNSFTVFDERMSQGSSNHSVVCIDGKSKHESGHLASTCFVSDLCVATLSLWTRPTSTDSTTAVRIWDIRMTSKSAPLFETALPSQNGQLSVTANSSVELNNQASWSNIPAHVRLTSSDSGCIMATIVTRKSAESYLLDPARASIVKQYCTPSSVDAIHAVAPSLDCLACHEMPALSLYDLSTAVDADENRRDRGAKRSFHSETNYGEVNHKHLIGTIRPTIEDEHGIRSRLQCLAFNETGTSLVGGTDAGDLFLWRGG